MTKPKSYTYRGITFTRFPLFETYDADYRPTVKQIKNMIDMAGAIQNSPPPEFDMGNYGDIDDWAKLSEASRNALNAEEYNDLYPFHMKNLGELGTAVAHSCGTSACAIGTAAYHGVGKIVDGMDWDTYSEKNFGLESTTLLWSFVFSGAWQHIDNTSAGAVARILALVTLGGAVVKENFDGYFYYDSPIVGWYAPFLDVKIGPKE